MLCTRPHAELQVYRVYAARLYGQCIGDVEVLD